MRNGLNLFTSQSICKSVLVSGFFALLISGCSPHQQLSSALHDYHYRLASVLEVEPIDIAFSAQFNFPAKSYMFRQLSSMSINFREFYSLPNCQLNTLIAERNTGLGKLQLPSQRFIYEANLLLALHQCVEVSEDKTIQNKLNQLLKEKLMQYPDSYANLIQTSDEVILSFTHANGFISGDSTNGLSQTLIALQYLLAINNANVETKSVISTELEASLNDLNRFRLVARLWRSQQLISQWFTLSNSWLNKHTQNINCKSRSGQETIQYLNNVFRLFFVDKIQPIAGQLNHYHYQLSPLLESMTKIPELDPLWRSEINRHILGEYQRYKTAMHEHVLVWQNLFNRCGMSPTSNNR